MLSIVFGSLHAFSVLIPPATARSGRDAGANELGVCPGDRRFRLPRSMRRRTCGGGRRPLPWRRLATVLAATGLMLAGFGHRLWPLLAGYGLLFGFANGMAYSLFLDRAAYSSAWQKRFCDRSRHGDLWRRRGSVCAAAEYDRRRRDCVRRTPDARGRHTRLRSSRFASVCRFTFCVDTDRCRSATLAAMAGRDVGGLFLRRPGRLDADWSCCAACRRAGGRHGTGRRRRDARCRWQYWREYRAAVYGHSILQRVRRSCCRSRSRSSP